MSQQKSNENNYDLYISYHPTQKTQVEEICSLFKHSGLTFWFNKDTTRKNFDEDLHALQQSYIFVCFPSKEYQKCIQNRIEYSIAAEQEMKIVNLNLGEMNSQLNETAENRIKTSVNVKSMNSSELNLVIRAIKSEANLIGKTFKQSFKHEVNTWYIEQLN